MKFSDKYKANAFMIAGLSCVWPIGNACANLITENNGNKPYSLMYWLAYGVLAVYGILMVYAAYKECQAKEGTNDVSWDE